MSPRETAEDLECQGAVATLQSELKPLRGETSSLVYVDEAMTPDVSIDVGPYSGPAPIVLDENNSAALTEEQIVDIEGTQVADGRKMKQVIVQGADGRARREFVLTNRAQRRNMDKSLRMPGNKDQKKKPRKSNSR